MVPEGAAVGAYYIQAINKDAPHPAAARLWEEFLYSDEGQNIWLKGFARPVRLDGDGEGRHHRQGGARSALPEVKGTPVYLTQQQIQRQQKYLLEHWNQAVE